MPDSHEVPARIRDLAAQLAQPKPMRRGSLLATLRQVQ